MVASLRYRRSAMDRITVVVVVEMWNASARRRASSTERKWWRKSKQWRSNEPSRVIINIFYLTESLKTESRPSRHTRMISWNQRQWMAFRKPSPTTTKLHSFSLPIHLPQHFFGAKLETSFEHQQNCLLWFLLFFYLRKQQKKIRSTLKLNQPEFKFNYQVMWI